MPTARCQRCSIVYVWRGVPLVRDARCQKCGQELRGHRLPIPHSERMGYEIRREKPPRANPRGYRHERLASPAKFDPRSLRTVSPRGRKGERVVIGCPKGKYDAKRKRCRVGTRAQAVLHPNPTPEAMFEQWHDFPADRVADVPIPRLGERMVFLGNLRRIDYESAKGSRRRPGSRPKKWYWHRSTGKPWVMTNPEGTVLLVWDPSGKFRVTADGIVN